MTIREHYSHKKADSNTKRKREEAGVRQKSRKQRTATQQLKKLDIEGRIAKKERVKLGKLI
ncbi:hypothetical protein LCGC14_0403960 [marine sediment metagenome]|uniref:Uncharacterized protein n=1 Tax=marine sediment metagenome TaxID=412755 RepID=A0A0F9TDU3_9ZZZZ